MSWTLETLRYDEPRVQLLVASVQAEYVRRYGSGDDTVLTVAHFLPPAGISARSPGRAAGGDGGLAGP